MHFFPFSTVVFQGSFFDLDETSRGVWGGGVHSSIFDIYDFHSGSLSCSHYYLKKEQFIFRKFDKP